jgi:nicotinamidase-related amidase
MSKILIIIDAQNDFITGVFGSQEAEQARTNICHFIDEYGESYDEIYLTRDTHNEDYLSTDEGHYLPVIHCIENSKGWQIDSKILFYLKDLKGYKYRYINKNTFGYLDWNKGVLDQMDEMTIDIIGFCTDICVVTNALILKAEFPEANITVYHKCCAGTNIKNHEAALDVMKSCQIEVC